MGQRLVCSLLRHGSCILWLFDSEFNQLSTAFTTVAADSKRGCVTRITHARATLTRVPKRGELGVDLCLLGKYRATYAWVLRLKL